jgi:hypothetical protein
MMSDFEDGALTRREIVKLTAGGMALSALGPWVPLVEGGRPQVSDIFSVSAIPNQPFRRKLLGRNHHVGVDCLFHLMGVGGLKLYRSMRKGPLSGRKGLIAADDVVLIKVNAQWKYRGCTNSDLIRGLIQTILEHPDGFEGEIVLVENGQGYGSLECAATTRYSDNSVHANANADHHSFTYVVDNLIADPRVSYRLLDRISGRFLEDSDHTTDGYRLLEDVSYPCFTTANGHRVELKEGIWTGSDHSQSLKLINVPVLKHHDRGGSEITASLKHVYGILSMKVASDAWDYRHYSGLGETCGKMIASVRAPVLNIIDAIWVSHPVALDYWSAKNILYPIDQNPRHHPDFEGIQAWMLAARDLINDRGGLWAPSRGLRVDRVTADEARMRVLSYSAKKFLRDVRRAARGRLA